LVEYSRFRHYGFENRFFSRRIRLWSIL